MRRFMLLALLALAATTGTAQGAVVLQGAGSFAAPTRALASCSAARAPSRRASTTSRGVGERGSSTSVLERPLRTTRTPSPGSPSSSRSRRVASETVTCGTRR